MGAAESSIKTAGASRAQMPFASEAHASSSTNETLHNGPRPQPTKRHRESDEQPRPSPKRLRPLLGATTNAIPVLHSQASTPLPIRSGSFSRSNVPLMSAAKPVIDLDHDNEFPNTVPSSEFQADQTSRPSPAESVTRCDRAAESAASITDLPYAAVQAAATLASEVELVEGWKLAPEAPLSDVQRQHNRREINRAIMRLQPLLKSASFGARTDEDSDMFATLVASSRKLKPEDSRVDFVQKAKAARLKARRQAARDRHPSEGKLAMPVSKKRRRSNEDVGGRSTSDVYKITQTDGEPSLFIERGKGH